MLAFVSLVLMPTHIDSNIMKPSMSLYALPGLPLVEPGDDVAQLLIGALQANAVGLQQDDVVVIAQKIVSKAENCYRRLCDVVVTDEARSRAVQCDKDPALVQLILDESKEVLRVRKGAIVVEHRNGYVHANAGIDRSNITTEGGEERVLLLPDDPDASANAIRAALMQHFGVTCAVIINDSAGRAWRQGTCGFTIGAAGIEVINNMIGAPDLFGRKLEITEVAIADELAAAASFLMGQADEASPVVLVRGARYRRSEHGSNALIRPRHMDLFR
jgi:coenzyme F420-0:L-glutamate ligase / coenzyme F420-1:gamma-L-glutamate ligase